MSPPSRVITKRRLPFVSLPKLTVPVCSARIAGSLGLRASNRSATRGRPPVISLLPPDFCGIRARVSPTPTSAPSSMLTIALPGKKYCAGISVPGIITSLPFASTNLIAGRISLPAAGRAAASVTSLEDRPVRSSV